MDRVPARSPRNPCEGRAAAACNEGRTKRDEEQDAGFGVVIGEEGEDRATAAIANSWFDDVPLLPPPECR